MRKNKFAFTINKYGYLIAALLITVFLFLSFPGNRVEADDAYRYAYDITHKSFANLYFSRYVFFLPFFKLLYISFNSVFSNIDGYRLMCAVSVICSTVTILNCYTILKEYFNTGKIASIVTCLLLLFSYGYWRYSVEAEIYSLVNMLNSFVLLYILKSVQIPNIVIKKYLVTASVFAGFAILIYKPAFIPLALSLPLLYLFKRKYTSFILFQIISAAIVVAGFYFAYSHAADNSSGFIAFTRGGVSHSGGNRLMGFFVFFGDIVSTNFLFGIERFIHFIQKNFSYESIAEEIFAAKTNGIFNYLSLLTLIVAAISFIYFFIKIIVSRKKVKFTSEHIVLLIWFFFYGGMVLFLDPNSPEPFVMVLVPFWLFIGSAFINEYQQSKPLISVYFLIAIIFLHNIIGGYKIFHSKKSSLIALKSDWILQNAKEGDVVLSSGQFSGLIWYIRYYTQADIFWRDENFNEWLPKVNSVIPAGHHLYLIIDEKQAMKLKNTKVTSQQIQTFIKHNSLNLKAVSTNDSYSSQIFELAKTPVAYP